MSLTERLERLQSEQREIAEDSNLKKLSDFYEEMKRKGVAVKQEYDLPPLDTVGRTFYRTMNTESEDHPK